MPLTEAYYGNVRTDVAKSWCRPDIIQEVAYEYFKKEKAQARHPANNWGELHLKGLFSSAIYGYQQQGPGRHHLAPSLR